MVLKPFESLVELLFLGVFQAAFSILTEQAVQGITELVDFSWLPLAIIRYYKDELFSVEDESLRALKFDVSILP